jgi:hypothetical protein
MKIHSRERSVTLAECDLSRALTDVWKKYDLTSAEMLRVVAQVLGGHISSHAKYEIREERHGDINKPGGLE